MEGESFWRARLAWRWRGALQWPLFVGLSLAEGLLLMALPLAGDGPTPFVQGALLSACINLFGVAVIAPLLALWLRRRRPDLPKVVAQDHAGTGVLVAILLALLAGGLLHAPARDEAERDLAAQAHAAAAFIRAQAPREYRGAVGAATTLKIDEDEYRTCVPGDDPDRWFCVLVSTDTSPPGVKVDPSRESNASLKPFGGG